IDPGYVRGERCAGHVNGRKLPAAQNEAVLSPIRADMLTYRPTISPDGVIAVPSVSFEPGKSKDAKPTPGLPGKWDVVRHWLFWSPSSLVTLVARKPCLAGLPRTR